ncbi:MAG: xanthine dehydrogenase family protein subunit M [Actinomycetia bacterium]|nr:xanthine dehydrogenase family protein subunit M [Actinomycetes bacterium]
MKPAPFRYVRARSVTEALEWLAREPGAKVLAGGQSLVPLLNMRLTRPDVVVDINGLTAQLAGVREEGERIRIGALTRHYQLETDALLRDRCPLIPEAERLIGHPAVRSRGTIGGSLAHADPAAELPAVFRLLEGTAVARSRRGVREIPADRFFQGYFTTDLAPDELLTEVILPARRERQGGALCERAARHGDFAWVLAGAWVTLWEDGRIRTARLVWGGVSDRPVRLPDVEAELADRTLEAARQVLRDLVPRAVEPPDDVHASAAFRRRLATVLADQALVAAARRAEAIVPTKE